MDQNILSLEDIDARLAFAVIQRDLHTEHLMRVLKLWHDPSRQFEHRTANRVTGKTNVLMATARSLAAMEFTVILLVPSMQYLQVHTDSGISVVTVNTVRGHRAQIALVDEPWLIGIDQVAAVLCPAVQKVYGLGTAMDRNFV